MNIFADQPLLPTIWFLIIGVFWVGYLILDGFDLGVGMMMSKFFSKNEKERRLLLNTIGPVWDGNEVWVVTGGAAIFAAFPFWYASLFSALYIPLTLALVFLILRVVAIDYRGKKNSEKWINNWNIALSLSSLMIAFLIGALLGITSTGLPVNENGDVTNGFAWMANPFAYVGGLAVVGLAYMQGLAFVALKTDGEIRHRARTQLVRAIPVAIIPALVWILFMQFTGGNVLSWIMVVLAVLALAFGFVSARSGREGRAFTGMSLVIAFGVLAIFLALFPNLLPSTIDASNSITVANGSSSEYTLRLMTWLAIPMLPFIIAYQAFTYWQFRKRIKVEHIPDAHDVEDLLVLKNRTVSGR